MRIINRYQQKRILTNGTLSTSLIKEYVLPEVNALCWYVGVGSFDSPKYVKDHIPKEILPIIKAGKIKLLLSMETESFPAAINLIYQDVVIGLDIEEVNIILVVSSRDMLLEVTTIAKSYNRVPLKTFWYNYFEHHMRDYKVIVNHTKPKLKKFLNLNRRARIDRLHRFLFVGLLETRNLVDKGYVSFQPEISWEQVWCQINDLIDKKYKNQVLNLKPLFVDTSDLSVNYNYPTEFTIPFYETSWFSVVSETYFFNNDYNRFLSEKTFKPIIHKHPFLLITSPNSLELLKEIGYKTFSPFFDESYDKEYDSHKRMVMILDEVERLCNLSDTEWHVLSIELNKICEYNYNVFMNKKDARDYIVPLN
jgi:hypothetical protein